MGANGSSRAPGVPRSPADWKAFRAAAVGRARPSGRQALATASPACGQDAASARRLHSGAEAVFLGAVALLGLVGLLHGACAGSSPSGLGVSPSSTPEGTQTRQTPESRAGRVHRPADDRSRASRASNDRAERGTCGVRRHSTFRPVRDLLPPPRSAVVYSPGVSRICLARARGRCYRSRPDAPRTVPSRPVRSPPETFAAPRTRSNGLAIA